MNGTNARLYLYGGEIRYCEANHGGAIGSWNSPGAGFYIFNTYIHHNFSNQVTARLNSYAAGTVYTYAASGAPQQIKMFGGVINNNQNPAVNSSYRPADISVYASSNADLRFYGGTVESISSPANNDASNLYIYAAIVDDVKFGVNSETNPQVHYPAQNVLYGVTIPDAVNAKGEVTVNVKAVKDGVTYANITGTGTATSSDITMQLPNGAYTITVTSPSMVKTYEVTVDGVEITAEEKTRTLTGVTLIGTTADSVTLGLAGTDNATDGTIYYGLSATNKAENVTDWYYVYDGKLYLNGSEYTDQNASFDSVNRTITFHYVYGPRYYFVKAGAVEGGFAEQITEGLFVPTKSAQSVTVSPEAYSSLAGSVVNFFSVVTYTDGTTDSNVKWYFIGGTSSSTTITQHGALHIATDEKAQPLLKTITTPVSDAKKLTFTEDNGVYTYTVGEGGLAYGCYYVEEEGVAYYFYTTSKLLSGDKLTWNGTDKTVTQSVNRIFVTAVSAIDSSVYKEVVWTQEEESGDAQLSEISVYFNGENIHNIISFTKENGTDSFVEEEGADGATQQSYNYKAEPVIFGAMPNDDVFLNAIPTESTEKYEVIGVYGYIDDGGNIKISPTNIGYNALYGFEVPNANANGVIVYIRVYSKDSSNIYRVQLGFNQQENYWIYHPSCPSVKEGDALNPLAEALYGTVQYEWRDKDGNPIEKPTAAGEYQLKAYVTATAFYTGLEETVSFTIFEDGQAVNFTFEGLDGMILTYGQKLGDISLDGLKAFYLGEEVPGEFAWVLPDTTPTVAESDNVHFPILFKPDSKYDYKDAVVYVTIRINKADLIIQPGAELSVPDYNGQTPAQFNALDSFDANDFGGPVVSKSNNVPVAGNWVWLDKHLQIGSCIGEKVQLMFIPDNENYNTVITDVTIKISVKIKADDKEITYSPGYILSPDYASLNGFMLRDGDVLSVTMAANANETAIIPTVVIKDGNGNPVDIGKYYNLEVTNGRLTVNPTTATLSLSKLNKAEGEDYYWFTFIYDGGADTASLTASYATVSKSANGSYSETLSLSGIESGREYTVYVKLTDSTNVATVSVSVSETNHYIGVSETLTLTGNYFVSGYTGVYDGNPHGITIDVVGDEEVLYYADENYTDGTTDSTEYEYVDAGTYTVYYTVGGNEGSALVVISKKSVTVVWTNYQTEYTAEEQTPKATVAEGSAEGSDDLTLKAVKVGEFTAVNVGSYSFTAQFKNADMAMNYTLTNDAVNLVISPATLTIDMSNPYNPVYDATVQDNPNWSITLRDGNAGTLSYTYKKKLGNGSWVDTNTENSGASTQSGAPMYAGTYQVTVSYAGNENYSPVANVVEFDVQRRKVTLKATDQFANHGGELVANKEYIVISGSFIGGHTPEVIGSGSIKGVGEAEKTITVSALIDQSGKNVLFNYEIDYESGRLVVTVVYIQQGAVREELSSGLVTEIYKGDSFTALFNFVQSDTGELTFHFDEALPNNTKLTLLDLCDGHSAFYYYVANGGEASVRADDFMKMGTATAGCSCESTTKAFQLIVKLPDDDATSKLGVELKQGEAVLSEAVYVRIVDAPAGATISDPTALTADTVGGVSTTVNVQNLNGDNNALAVKLLDEKGEAVDFPVGVDVKVNEASPVAIRDGYAFFNSVVSGENKVKISNMPTGNYQIVFALCTNTVAAYPMADVVMETQAQKVEVTNEPCAITVSSDDSRIFTSDTDKTLTFNVSIQGTGDLTVEYLKKNEQGYEQTTEEISGTITVDGTTTTVTVTVRAGTSSGTYRIRFVYGDAEYLYNFIVE